MPFWGKLTFNTQQQRVSSSWQESKTRKSVMEPPQSSSRQDSWWLLQDHLWKWISTPQWLSQLITKPWNLPRKLLLIFRNLLMWITMRKSLQPYKIVLVPNSPADGENLFQTSPSRPLKSSWEKEPRTNSTYKSKDMPRYRKFPEVLLNNQKS